MRLIERNDTSLALALIAGAVVIFQQPLRLLVDAARAVELRYNVALLPGLTVLVCAFGFHQYSKRQQARAAELAATADAAVARARSVGLERLVAFGRALGAALDPAAMRQVFWRYVPSFAGEREMWMLTRKPDGWEPALRDLAAAAPRAPETLEAMAGSALARPAGEADDADGIQIGDDLCFPMVIGDTAIGVIGVRNGASVTDSERRALSAAAALLAIAIRNSQLLAQTHESSIRDSLTGCFNRAYAMEALEAELHRAKRTKRPLSVMMFDIDEFKATNDRFGHLTGDAVLSAIGARSASILRATDVKCRYGGDEFLIILPDTPPAGAERAAATLTREIALLQVATPTGTLSPTVSLGVTAAFDGELDATGLIARADEALYRAKRSGRNRYATSLLAQAV